MLAEKPGDLFISVITLAELLYGTYRSSAPEQARQRWLKVIKPLALLSFSEECAHFHAQIRYALRHRPIGERDLLIASIALGYGLRLVTHNSGEFERVAGLSWEDWY